MNNREAAEAFVKAWKEGQKEFVLRTSGSTGEPKDIILQREWMQWSAAHTASYLQPLTSDKMICCLPVNKVGGLMMLVRSLEWQIPIEVIEPVADPFTQSGDATIISLTPFQLHHILKNPQSMRRLLLFREVLTGGGELSYMLEKHIQLLTAETCFRHSYGMTETYSHIALRNINGIGASEWFTPFSDVTIQQDASGSAVIYTPFAPDGFITNDLIELDTDKHFKVTGRKDFIINTGGIKLQPEVIEQRIFETSGIKTPFLISSIADAALGNKLVLVSENKADFENLDLQFLKEISPYAVPKKFLQMNPLPLNEGGKTDRLRIKELINS